MILRALTFDGILDVSGPEVLGENVEGILRRSVKTGDILEIPDEFFKFPNILNAVSAGLLEIVSFDSSDESKVINAELEERLDDLLANIPAFSRKREVQIEHSRVNVAISPPLPVQSGKLFAMAFAAGSKNGVDFAIELPTDVDATKKVEVNVVFHRSTAGSGDILTKVEYDVINEGADTTPASPTGTTTAILSTAEFEIKREVNYEIPSSDIPGSDATIRFTLIRDGDSVFDTFLGTWIVESVSIRYND